MSESRGYAKLSLVIGVLLVLVGVALVIMRIVLGGSSLEVMAAITAIAAGAISIVRALGQLRPDDEVDDDPVDDAPLPDPPPEDSVPVVSLGPARTAAIAAGVIAVVCGATWIRHDLFEGFPILSSLVTVAGGALFLVAYGKGRRVTSELRPGADTWDRAAQWVIDHGAVPALILLTAIAGMMYARIFLGETTGDDNTFHMAESRRIADCIAAGDWDFWNPSANAGFASAYYYQVIPLLASALPAALFGDHLFWFQVSLWLPQVGIPLAAYRGMRLMGAAPWQAFCAAFAVTFISGASRWGTGADGTFNVGLFTQTWAMAAFPLGLGHGVRYLLEGKSLPNAIAWGAFVFLCHPFASIGLCAGLAFGVLAHYLKFPVRTDHVRWILAGLVSIALVVTLYQLVNDPVPPPKPEQPIGWKPRPIYIAPAILFAGLLARVLMRSRPLTKLLIAGVAIAFVANAIGFAVWEGIPKRPEGATQDLPPKWWLGGASLYIGPLILLAAIAGRLALSLRRPIVEPAGPSHALRLVGFGLATLVAGGAFVAVMELDGFARYAAVSLVVVAGAMMVVLGWRVRREPLVRLVVVGACLAVATAPGWLTLIVDREGFGGFPHRVADEVGPGYQELMRWYTRGALLDNARLVVLTYALPLVILFARMRFARWLWAPALLFATLLVLGPHAPKTDDDLLPAVRFLGALQVVLALAAGAGLYAIGRSLWHLRGGSVVHRGARVFAGNRPEHALLYGVRTAVIAIAAVLLVLVGIGGSAPARRIFTLPHDYDYRGELVEMNHAIGKLPQGRKQSAVGADNHWWNLLSYVHVRRPSLLQMGGGGLQASPNYDFVWSVRDFPKLAWVYDTPLFVLPRASAASAPEGDILFQTARYELRKLDAPGIVSPIHITGVLPEGESRAGSKVREAAIAWLKTRAPLDNQHLAYHGHGHAGAPPRGSVVRAFRVDPSPGDLADIYADLDIEAPTTFVIRESWHPRWKAYVDGIEVPIRRVTPDFPAVDVPAGKHTLALRFERPWWATAAWLLWPGIVLAAWLAGRKRRATTADML